MASFFGEINALSSRAVDDEEIDDEPTYNLTLDPKSNIDGETDCKLLITSVGDLAIAFSKCYLISESATHLFDVKYSSSKTETESTMYTGFSTPQTKGLKAASVYKMNGDIIVCEISVLIPEEINMDLCSMILDKITCSEALVLTSRHMANFKSAESMESEAPFLKALPTSEYLSLHTRALPPRLQAPNFISGFPAALLSEFQVKNRAALCVVNYVDSDRLDSLNVQTFERIQDVELNVKLSFVTDAKAKLVKYVKAKHSIESNLYT